jgi:deoxycytidylate deaminase
MGILGGKLMNFRHNIVSGIETAGTIQVFVNNEKVPVRNFQTYEFTSPGHECTRKLITVPIFESVLPEIHEQVIKLAERVAEEKGMKLKVYNLSSRMGKVKAVLKGVKETPTIIVGNHKISEEITEKKLLYLLE